MSKRVAVINDISGLGRCSLGAALPVLAALGVQACPVPTAVLTAQTGYPGAFLADCASTLPHYATHWAQLGMSFDGLCTGFFSNTEQIDGAEEILRAFKTPRNFFLADPVLGDGGRRYPGFSDELCARVRRLALTADIITPNLTELCLLSGTDYAGLTEKKSGFLACVQETARGLLNNTLKTVVVTGVAHAGAVYNVAVTQGSCFALGTRRLRGDFSGTGDLFAAVLCGGLARGWPLEQTARLAARFLRAAIARSVAAGGQGPSGVDFEASLWMLTGTGAAR